MSQVINKLSDLEVELRPLSHGMDALNVIQKFSKGLGKLKDRVEVFNSYGALVTRPIDYPEAVSHGAIPETEDRFWLLQGDIITTNAAFSFGERVTAPQKYVVVNSTCDLVPGRKRKNVLLFEIQAVKKPQTGEDVNAFQSRMDALLQFKNRNYMYLPPMADDPDDVAFNVISFDDPAMVKLDAVILADRVASMSLVGWRLFASLLRVNMAREAEAEAVMREVLAPHLLNPPAISFTEGVAIDMDDENESPMHVHPSRPAQDLN